MVWLQSHGLIVKAWTHHIVSVCGLLSRCTPKQLLLQTKRWGKLSKDLAWTLLPTRSAVICQLSVDGPLFQYTAKVFNLITKCFKTEGNNFCAWLCFPRDRSASALRSRTCCKPHDRWEIFTKSDELQSALPRLPTGLALFQQFAQ